MSRWRENYKPIKKGRLIMKKFFELSTKILYSMIICLTLVLVGMVISKNVAAAQEVTLDEGMIKNILCPSNTTNTVKIDNKTYTIYWANKFVKIHDGTVTTLKPFSYFFESEFFNKDGSKKEFGEVITADPLSYFVHSELYDRSDEILAKLKSEEAMYQFSNNDLLLWDGVESIWRKNQKYNIQTGRWVEVVWDDESNDYIPVDN